MAGGTTLTLATGDTTIFTVGEARAYDKAQLTSSTTYPSATITAAEIDIRAKFERIIGIPLTATAFTEYYDGDGTNTLFLRHHQPYAAATPSPVTLTSVTVISTDDTETAFTAGELSDCVKYPDKLVRRTGVFDSGTRNIKVVYTCGYTSIPDDIKKAALQVLLLPPPKGLVPSSVTSFAIDGSEGTINYTTQVDPERGRWYGNESIDGTLRYHRGLEYLPVIV